MTGTLSRERGRADVAALGLSLLLGAAALAPGFLLRTHRGWAKCRDEGLAGAAEGAVGTPAAATAVDPIPRALAAAEGTSGQVTASAFRTDPSRQFRPLSGPAEAARCSDLDGRVVEGRLRLRWRPWPGSRGTAIRVEGLGGPGVHEEEIPADRGSLDLPVPGASGTILVRALPAGLPGLAAEVRVSIPFRIPVEVVRVERPDENAGSAILVLRRAYDGALVEAEFPVHVSDEVGGLSPTAPGGSVADFRTGFVLGEVRRSPDHVPEFDAEGRVRRDGAGHPLLRTRDGSESSEREVVLRGPNDERKSIRAE